MGAMLGIPKMPDIGPSPEDILKIGEQVRSFVITYRDSYVGEWNKGFDAGERDAKKLNEEARKVADKKAKLDDAIDKLVEESGPIKSALEKQLDDGLGSNASNVPQQFKDKAVDKALHLAYATAIDVALQKESQRMLDKKLGNPDADADDSPAGVGSGSDVDIEAAVGVADGGGGVTGSQGLSDAEAVMKKVQYVDQLIAALAPIVGAVDAVGKKLMMELVLRDFPAWKDLNGDPANIQRHVENMAAILADRCSGETMTLAVRGAIADNAMQIFSTTNVKCRAIAAHVDAVVVVLQDEGAVSSADSDRVKLVVLAVTLKNYPSLITAC